MNKAKLTFRNRSILIADTQMERVLQMAKRAAQTASPVLICGESGTGKELVARYIHEMSMRTGNPFIAVNCAAIPEGLMESELFGFEKGAFTGAIYQRIGRFEAANGGTLLLDEVSEMPFPLQAKLLRVLQEGEIDRLGGRESVPITSRVIATSNKDPMKLIQDGKFREDLFYRLNVIRIECSSLRGRKQAIQSLAEEFLVESNKRHGLSVAGFSTEAMQKLFNHSWPGNVRELQNVIERTVLNIEGNKIEESDIHFFFTASIESKTAFQGTLAQLEKEHILSSLQKNDGNRMETAKNLGISVRTLRNKLKEYTI